jgi:hypothetical protein
MHLELRVLWMLRRCLLGLGRHQGMLTVFWMLRRRPSARQPCGHSKPSRCMTIMHAIVTT